MLAQSLKRPQQHRQTLPLACLPDKCDTKRAGSRGTGRRGLSGYGHAVRNDAVGATKVASASPGRRLRDSDSRVESVEPARRSKKIRRLIGERVLRLAVEGPNERGFDRAQRVPPWNRSDRL